MSADNTGIVPGVVRGEAAASIIRSERADDAVHEFLAFRLGNETYALPLAGVQEILKLPRITRVPRSSYEVLGIVSVRGRVTTVIDLRRRLQLKEGPLDKNTRVLLVDAGDEILGMLVDSVLQVYRLYEDEVEMASTVGGDMNDYVLGIGRPRAVRTLGRSSSQDRDDPNDILILLHAEPLLKR